MTEEQMRKEMKFWHDDKVLANVNGMEKEGIVVGAFYYLSINGEPPRIEYDVKFKYTDYLQHHAGDGSAVEYFNIWPTYRFNEDEVKKVEEIKISIDLVFNSDFNTNEAMKKINEDILKSFALPSKILYDNASPSEILDAMTYTMFGIDFSETAWKEINEGPPIKECNHKWKRYDGFSKSYNFCELCDLKDET